MPNSPTLQHLTPNAVRLAEHADEIRKYQALTIENIIEIGAHLIAARPLAGHGNWLVWLDQNFGWSERTARRFMQVAANRSSVADLNVPISSLYQLTAPSTPETVRDVVVEKAKTAKVTHKEVVQAVRAATEPKTKASVKAPPTKHKAGARDEVDKPTSLALAIWRVLVEGDNDTAWPGAINRIGAKAVRELIKMLETALSRHDRGR